MGANTVKKYLPNVNKNYLWGALIVGGVIIGIYYYGKNNGSFTPYVLPNDTPPVTNDPNDPNALTDTEQQSVVAISNHIRSIVDGYFNVDYTAYKELLTCSDRVFVGVYNFYSANFCTVPDTFRTALEHERRWYLPLTDANNDSQSILNRMDRLNLK